MPTAKATERVGATSAGATAAHPARRVRMESGTAFYWLGRRGSDAARCASDAGGRAGDSAVRSGRGPRLLLRAGPLRTICRRLAARSRMSIDTTHSRLAVERAALWSIDGVIEGRSHRPVRCRSGASLAQVVPRGTAAVDPGRCRLGGDGSTDGTTLRRAGTLAPGGITRANRSMGDRALAGTDRTIIGVDPNGGCRRSWQQPAGAGDAARKTR